MSGYPDRAALLAALADEFMANGCAWPHPGWLPVGCRSLRAAAYPDSGKPREVRFTAEWPGITLVCSRQWGRQALPFPARLPDHAVTSPVLLTGPSCFLRQSRHTGIGTNITDCPVIIGTGAIVTASGERAGSVPSPIAWSTQGQHFMVTPGPSSSAGLPSRSGSSPTRSHCPG